MKQNYIKINTDKSYEVTQTDATLSASYQTITQAQWDTIIAFHNTNASSSQFFKIDPVTLIPYIDTALQSSTQLLNAQKAKEAEIRASAAQAAEAVVAQYYTWERLTWFKQTAEAEAWTANNTASTPYIDAAVAARKIIEPGFTKLQFVTNVLAKRDAFNLAVAPINGKQGALLAKVYDPAATKASVQTIIW